MRTTTTTKKIKIEAKNQTYRAKKCFVHNFVLFFCVLCCVCVVWFFSFFGFHFFHFAFYFGGWTVLVVCGKWQSDICTKNTQKAHTNTHQWKALLVLLLLLLLFFLNTYVKHIRRCVWLLFLLKEKMYIYRIYHHFSISFFVWRQTEFSSVS